MSQNAIISPFRKEFTMTIPSVSSGAAATILTPTKTAATAVAQRPATDGDSPAVEAAESAATKQAEKAGGGFSKLV
jgi:hypothetical protein